MFVQKEILIVWVNKNQIAMMGDKITEPARLAIPEEVVSHLEVIDRDAFYTLIKEWLKNYPAKGQQVVWVFGSDVYFDQVIKATEKEEQEATALQFLELLPFDEVESRVYSGTSQQRVVAVSAGYYRALKRGFELQGFTTRFEIPDFLLGKVAEGGQLTRQVVKGVTGNLAALEKQRLVEPRIEAGIQAVVGGAKSKSMLPILVVVFGFLLVVLAVMLTRM